MAAVVSASGSSRDRASVIWRGVLARQRRRGLRFRRSRLGCTCRAVDRWRLPSRRSSRRMRGLRTFARRLAAMLPRDQMLVPQPRRTPEVRSRLRLVGGGPGGLKFLLVACDQRTHGELCQGDGGDQRLGGERCRVLELGQQDDRRGVKNASRWKLGAAHGVGSRSLSMSALRTVGSIGGSCLRRASSASADNRGRGTGRSSATGLPALVIVIGSPRPARSTTSPPLFRRSRMLTSVIRRAYHV